MLRATCSLHRQGVLPEHSLTADLAVAGRVFADCLDSGSTAAEYRLDSGTRPRASTLFANQLGKAATGLQVQHLHKIALPAIAVHAALHGLCLTAVARLWTRSGMLSSQIKHRQPMTSRLLLVTCWRACLRSQTTLEIPGIPF